MESPQVPKHAKPSSSNAWDIVRTSLCLGPLIWCLKMYDNHWVSRHRPDIHELARRARGEVAKDAPVPLPLRRKRTLTNPLPALDTITGLSNKVRRSRQRTSEQPMCRFLTKLPYELRLMIYREVLVGSGKGNVVHILRKHQRLGHWRCRLQQDGLELCDSDGQRCVEGWLSYKAKVWRVDKAGRLDLITDDGLLPFLRTCRAM